MIKSVIALSLIGSTAYAGDSVGFSIFPDHKELRSYREQDGFEANIGLGLREQGVSKAYSLQLGVGGLYESSPWRFRLFPHIAGVVIFNKVGEPNYQPCNEIPVPQLKPVTLSEKEKLIAQYQSDYVRVKEEQKRAAYEADMAMYRMNHSICRSSVDAGHELSKYGAIAYYGVSFMPSIVLGPVEMGIEFRYNHEHHKDYLNRGDIQIPEAEVAAYIGISLD